MRGDDAGCEHGLQFLCGRSPVQGQREAIVVVSLLPVGQWAFGLRLHLEVVTAPELLIIDAMTAFDLAILLRAPRFDVAVTNAELFDGQLEREWTCAAIVTLPRLDPERQRTPAGVRLRSADSSADSPVDTHAGRGSAYSRRARCTERPSRV